MKTMLKKVISMLIAVCLMIGIANIPAYAAVSATAPIKTTEAVLSKPYSTPAQLAKQVAVKPKATVTKTTKTKATKKVSLTTQIIKKYTKTGLNVLKKLASKVGLKLKTVYNSFIKMGVTKAQLKKVANRLLKFMKKGENFKNCASLAVARYLGISQSLAAVQNLAADISLNLFDDKKVFTGTTTAAELKTLQKNGHKKATEYSIKLSDFKSALKVGQKAIIHVDCFDGQGHSITVIKQKNNKFAVYDIMRNNGNKIIYTSSQFNKLMNGTIKNAYYKAVKTRELYRGMGTNALAIKYKYKGINIITDSKNISKKVAAMELKYSIANKLKKQNIDLINKQLQTKGLSTLAKTWLQEAKKLINKVAKGEYIKPETTYINKEEFLRKSLTALKEIEKANFSTISLIEHSNRQPYISYDSETVFYPLKEVFKNDINYKIYGTYYGGGLKVIDFLSKKFNLSQTELFEYFKKFEIEEYDFVFFLSAANNDVSKIIDENFLNNNESIKYGYENTKKAIRQLIANSSVIAA